MSERNPNYQTEFKIRLSPADADLVCALARKLDIPPAALIRRWVVAAVGPAAVRIETPDR